nr:LiaF domain-containing protein [Streptomyces spiramenti]
MPAGQRPSAPRPPTREEAARLPGPRNVVAVLGGADRQGSWRVGAQMNAIAVCGGVDIDLTEAIFDQPEVVINATAVCGGISIQVPENITLVCEGSGIMGSFDAREMVAADPAAPVVRLRGVAIWGAVEASAVEGKRVQNLRASDG